jgi:branched-chain amino acid transport system ATP-binding protein
MGEALLAVEALRAGYVAGQPVVDDVSVAVGQAELVAVFGPNGAGKSTLAKAVAGTVGRFAGRVRFAGADITGWPPWRIAQAGLAYVPQRDNVFAALTVRENLDLGMAARAGRGGAGVDMVLALFPGLASSLHRRAGVLSGGTRQMVAIGRALRAAPLLLLLDEPTAGLSPLVAGEVMAALGTLKRKLSILLVEQNVSAALTVADRAVLLVDGRVRRDTGAAALRSDPALAQAFLGAEPA